MGHYGMAQRGRPQRTGRAQIGCKLRLIQLPPQFNQVEQLGTENEALLRILYSRCELLEAQVAMVQRKSETLVS